MFTCAICGLELKPNDAGVDRKATVWLKGATKTVSEFVEDVYEYKHRVCNDRDPHRNDIPLF
jgi:hypothetical protein